MELIEKKGASGTDTHWAQEPEAVTALPIGSEDSFQPKGAFAFFALLIILGLLIWFGIYFLMLDRI